MGCDNHLGLFGNTLKHTSNFRQGTGVQIALRFFDGNERP